MITERAVVAAMAQALRVPVTAASATGTHLETGFRIKPALHAADRLPVARAAKPMPLNQPAPMALRWAADTALTAGPASLPATPARELETRG